LNANKNKINLPELLKNSGFEKIERKFLTFGIVQVIIAAKTII